MSSRPYLEVPLYVKKTVRWILPCCTDSFFCLLLFTWWMFYNCCCIAVSVMASDKVDSYCCSCCLILDDPLTCSCWASWFSSPSTMQENLSLLFFSAVTVMAARILSKLKKKKNPKTNREQSTNMFIPLLTEHLLTLFTRSSLVWMCLHLCVCVQYDLFLTSLFHFVSAYLLLQLL